MYIIKQSFCEDVSYFLTMTRNIAEWVGKSKYAHIFKTKGDAERMIQKIIKISPSVGALEAIYRSNSVCNFDCFHCPFPDCCNGRAKRTDWEKRAIRCAKMDL